MKIKKPYFLSLFTEIKNIFTTRKGQMVFSAVACAFVISFSFIGLSRFEHNGQGLMASVAQLNNPQEEKFFQANLVLRDAGENFEIIAGNDMKTVDTIEGFIAFDPTKNLIISHPNIISMEGGMYRFSFSFENQDIKKWTVLATIEKNNSIKIPVTLIDTQFVSDGQRYNLTNAVE